MAFCIQCGSSLPDNAKFCTNCGNSISNSSTPSNIYTEPSKVLPTATVNTNLKKCESCGMGISPKAESCIHCGHVYIQKRNAFQSFISFVVKGFLIYGVIFCAVFYFALIKLPEMGKASAKAEQEQAAAIAKSHTTAIERMQKNANKDSKNTSANNVRNALAVPIAPPAPEAHQETETASNARLEALITKLITKCEGGEEIAKLSPDDYIGKSFRGLRLYQFYSFDSDEGSKWGVTFKSSMNEVTNKIPEAFTSKTHFLKDSTIPITLQAEAGDNVHDLKTDVFCSFTNTEDDEPIIIEQ